MLSQLKSPPAVLRYAVLAHFCSKRGALKEPVRGWVADGKVAVAGASGSTDAGGVATLFASLDRSATEFAAALDSMENPVASSGVSGGGGGGDSSSDDDDSSSDDDGGGDDADS